MTRKIKSRKLSMILLGRFVIRLRGFCFCLKTSQMYVPSVSSYTAIPSLTVSVNTPKAGFVNRTHSVFTVNDIVSSRSFSQIAVSVIQCVMVFVITPFAFLSVEDDALHGYSLLWPYAFGVRNVSRRIKALCVFIPKSKPYFFHTLLIAMSTDSGVLVLCQWDFPTEPPFDLKDAINDWRFVCPNPALFTHLGLFVFGALALWANGLPRFVAISCRMVSRLDNLFAQAHVPTPIGRAGQAALELF